MGCPEPTRIFAPFHGLANRAVIERFTPRHLQCLELEAEPSGVVEQTVPKFAVAQNQTRLLQQRELRSHRIIGQAARAGLDFHPACAHQLTEEALRGMNIDSESIRAMRD